MVTKPKPKVELKPTMPVQLALSYSEGKIVSGRFGEQVMYSLADGRVMYLNFKVAEKINALELNVREPFFVCKYWSGKKGDTPHWNVWRSNDAEKERANEEMGVENGCRPPAPIPEEDSWKAGNQPDGTFVIPAPGTPTLPLHAAVPRPESQPDAGTKEGETDLEKKLRESIALVQLRKTGEGAGPPAPSVAPPGALPVHNPLDSSNGSAGEKTSLNGSNGTTGGSAAAN